MDETNKIKDEKSHSILDDIYITTDGEQFLLTKREKALRRYIKNQTLAQVEKITYPHLLWECNCKSPQECYNTIDEEFKNLKEKHD